MTVAHSKAKILIVEDEEDIRELIELHLLRDGYAVEFAADGEAGRSRLKSARFELLVLDWMLPGVSGVEIVRGLRAGDGGEGGTPANVPVLMVTARAESADIVLGLEAGADDYVVKPFDFTVLLARVRSLLRRAEARETDAPEGKNGIRLGELTINPETYEVHCAQQSIALTASEFKLLLALAEGRGRVLTRDRLIDAVQGAGVTVVDRAIDTHVFGLRKKLGNCADVIETVRGVGYRVRP